MKGGSKGVDELSEFKGREAVVLTGEEDKSRVNNANALIRQCLALANCTPEVSLAWMTEWKCEKRNRLTVQLVIYSL